ncbi:hypothetical protein M0802_015366 [Mischocyttarus mexicanus]|nr:hypothetical protein M0802_015366 [Mischocyttarus mexicanus]
MLVTRAETAAAVAAVTAVTVAAIIAVIFLLLLTRGSLQLQLQLQLLCPKRTRVGPTNEPLPLVSGLVRVTKKISPSGSTISIGNASVSYTQECNRVLLLPSVQPMDSTHASGITSSTNLLDLNETLREIREVQLKQKMYISTNITR